MRKVELTLDKTRKDERNGVFAMSIVKSAAMEAMFVKLSEEEKQDNKQNFMFSDANEQQIITGIALIPEKLIYRKDVGGDEGYVFFSKETVKDLAYMFLSENRNNNATLEHQEATNDITLLESWVVESTQYDKSIHLGIDAPLGSWMVSYKVNDNKLWEEIKLGKYTGFSIESRMIATIIDQFSEQQKDIELTEEQTKTLIDRIVQDYNNINKKD